MKITVRHRGTEIVVEETHEKERVTMRYSDQNKQIQETITVIADQVNLPCNNNQTKMLKLKDIRTDLKFIKNHGLSIFCIRDLIDKNERYNLDFDVYLKSKGKNLQRPFCWTLLQKQELIMSILKGIRIPILAIIQHTDDYKQREEKIYHIIDGKQRLSTMISFAKGEFPIIFNGQEYFIKDLDEWAACEILNYWVTADVAYSYPDVSITDDQKIAWFEMINFTGTPQDIEHLNNLKA